MFGRNSSKQVADATPADAVPAETGTSGKGRATPTRKEAEAARKLRLGALPADPKARRQAEREANRASYDRSRQALRSGDERHYPARDQGPAKAFVRDYVDGRIRLLEMLMPLVILCWATLLMRNTSIYIYSSFVMEVVVVVGIVLGILLGQRVKRRVAADFGPEEARGTGFYAFSRAVMPRFLRQPRPRVTMRGEPKVR
ncbi:MAG TPA: DUF3043 domain-containing protein [Actinospica sp.]|jgi:hypothetical protein|nr:DUF3043 domain-containing protein [Actinospica sp.]